MEDSVDEGFVGGESSWDRCLRDLVDEVQFIVLDASKTYILVVPGDTDQRLPAWYSGCMSYCDIERMEAATGDLFGAEHNFTVLQSIWRDIMYFYLKVTRTHYMLGRSVVKLECRAEMNTPPEGMSWVKITEADIYHSEDKACEAIKRELEWIACGFLPELRVPWANPGWYVETEKWMDENLQAIGVRKVGALEQLQVSPCSNVLKAQSEIGDLYVKASASFCNEAAFSDILSDADPVRVLKPVIADREGRVFVAKDNKGPGTGAGSEKGTSQLLNDLASIQKASVTKIDELREAGLPYFGVAWALEHFDELLDDEELSFMRESSEMKKVHEQREGIQVALRKLNELTAGLPDALVHGDLCGRNLFPREDESGGYGFFDWDYSFIGLPLCDIVEWECTETQRDEYLEEWTDYGSLTELRDALSILRGVLYVFFAFRSVRELKHTEDTCKEFFLSSVFHDFKALGLKFGRYRSM